MRSGTDWINGTRNREKYLEEVGEAPLKDDQKNSF